MITQCYVLLLDFPSKRNAYGYIVPNTLSVIEKTTISCFLKGKKKINCYSRTIAEGLSFEIAILCAKQKMLSLITDNLIIKQGGRLIIQ